MLLKLRLFGHLWQFPFNSMLLLLLSLTLLLITSDVESYPSLTNRQHLLQENLLSEELLNGGKSSIIHEKHSSSSLDETIEEVQKILHQDPTLPRLTR